MDWLNHITSALGSVGDDPERVRVLFVALLAFLGFVFTLAVSMMVGAVFDPLRKRIGSLHDSQGAQTTGEVKGQFIQSLGKALVPKAESKKTAMLLRLEHAGFRSPRALALFFGIKLLGFVFVPLLFAAAIGFVTPWTVFDWLSPIVFSSVAAFVLPDVWLSRRVKRRQKLLRHALPDALDLMVVCTEAGLGLNSAIKRVADDIGVQHPELADELQLTIMQIRAGMENREALKELERRTGLDDIKAFVTTLLQAMRFGTSVSESLRVFAEDMRDKRLQRAQEIAARLSVTMLMPIALCMMPMFLLMIMGPSLLVIMDAITSMGSRG